MTNVFKQKTTYFVLKGNELKSEYIYNIDDYGALAYDENYRSIFDLRSCIESFRDRVYIGLVADFGK